jgi:hypothetical protein
VFTEIAVILEKHSLGMGLVFLLFFILFDQRALDRINKKLFVKRFLYVVIIIYYSLIIIEVIENIHPYY